MKSSQRQRNATSALTRRSENRSQPKSSKKRTLDAGTVVRAEAANGRFRLLWGDENPQSFVTFTQSPRMIVGVTS